MEKCHLYIIGSETSLRLDQKLLDRKFIGQKDIGQKDVNEVPLDELTSDEKLIHVLIHMYNVYCGT